MLTAVTSDVERHRPPVWTALAGALIGTLFFIWIAGTRVLDPREIDWLMKGDWAEHYFGWHYFRTEPWHWPPGTIHGYLAPLGTSVGLTDSIPLVAYPLKLLSAWLPTPFQFLGPFVLACFALQGALGARLIARGGAEPLAQLLGATLFVLLPTLLARVGHSSLCAHWLVLWALLVATRPPSDRFRVIEWAVLGAVAGLVHPYLAAMVLALLGATALGTTTIPVARRGSALAGGSVAMLGAWWLSGMFILGGTGGALAAGGLGYYSMNLLAFVTPDQWSSFLPAMPLASPGQAYEGFHYLGLGVLALTACALVLVVTRPARPTRPLRSHGAAGAALWPPAVVAVCVGMAAFAVSPVVTLGSRTLVDVNGAWSAPLGMFRASGRFAWPLVYLLVAAAIVTVARRLPARAASGVLAGAVVLQLADLSAAHASRRAVVRDPAFHAWDDPFADERWHIVAPHYAHLVLVPPPQCGEAPAPYEPAMHLAARHGLTVNAGIVSRQDEAARVAYCTALDADVRAARLRDDTLYVVAPSLVGSLDDRAGGNVACGHFGRLTACTTHAARARWSRALTFD